MEFKQINRLEQKQLLSQKQIQSLNILAMNNYDLSRFLQEQALVNPLINLETATPASSGSDTPLSANAGNIREQADISEFRSKVRKSNEANEGFYDIPDHRLTNAATYLQNQLNHNLYTHREEYLLYFLTELVDDNGYLRHTLNELTYMTGYPMREVKHAVRIIQSLSPSGVGAYNLQECLLLQAKLLFPTHKDLHMMISYHLENLATHQYQCIADDMALPLKTVKEYADLIRTLNPKPLNGLVDARSHYTIPDIIFYWDQDGWTVALNDQWVGKISILPEYQNMNLSHTDETFRNYYNSQKEHALFLNDCIEKRRNTLLKLSRFLLTYQELFFSRSGDMKSLTLKQAAQSIGIHESTVSRAIRDKYVQTPHFTLPMKAFFPSSTLFQGNDSSMQIELDDLKQRIKTLIAGEPSQKPYSDSSIVTMLKKEGVTLSRRTVAKYRSEMGILGSSERKSTQ